MKREIIRLNITDDLIGLILMGIVKNTQMLKINFKKCY
jgi:glycerol-3-phosphate dehydrogenase